MHIISYLRHIRSPEAKPTPLQYNVPSTSDVSNDNSVAFLRPGGRDTPIDSSLCRRTWPPFFDFALQECSFIFEVCIRGRYPIVNRGGSVPLAMLCSLLCWILASVLGEMYRIVSQIVVT